MKVKWILQLNQAMVSLHESCPEKSQLLHRDIKAENVLITGEGVAKICDFR